MNNCKKLIKLLYGLQHSAGEYPAPISSSLPALEYTLFLEPIFLPIFINIYYILNIFIIQFPKLYLNNYPIS